MLKLACDVVRFSSDGSLVRVIRQFDATRRMLQRRLNEEQASLAHQALHDQLTGLPNRALLTDRLEHAAASLERRQHGAMLLLPRPGQLQGGQRPIRARRRGLSPGGRGLPFCRELVRTSDTVARLGGDEFVVLAEGLDDPPAAARALAERIHVAMRPPVAMGDRHLYTSVSIGIAEVLPDLTPEVNLSQADAAMYQAKRGGPARYEYYNAVIGEDSLRQSQLAHDLRVAHQCGRALAPLPTVVPDGWGDGGDGGLVAVAPPRTGSRVTGRVRAPARTEQGDHPIGRWVLHEAAGQCRSGRSRVTPT